MHTIQHHIRPSAALKATLGASVVLVGVSLAARLLWVTGNLEGYDATANAVLNVDAEGNLPTWFASALLLSSGLVAFVISFAVATSQRRVWKTFAALVTFVSADEAASLHEKMISPLRTIFNSGGIFHFAWIIVAIPAVIVAAVVLRRIFVALNRRESVLLRAALGLLVVGAIGGEMASGPFADRTDSITYILITHVEEALEFSGASLLLFALLVAASRLLTGHTVAATQTEVGGETHGVNSGKQSHH